MATSYMALAVNCGISQRRPAAVPDRFSHPTRNTSSSVFKPMWRGFQGPILKTIKETGANLLEAFADSTFEFVDQPVLPSQRNFAPVEELGDAVAITSIEGQVPDGFPDGVYIRNGANPLFGGLKSASLCLGGQMTFGWKVKECFMLFISENRVMEAGLCCTIENTLKLIPLSRKHTETKELFSQLQMAIHSLFYLPMF